MRPLTHIPAVDTSRLGWHLPLGPISVFMANQSIGQRVGLIDTELW
jgi:hypothetical protein